MDSIIIKENAVDDAFVDGLLSQKNYVKANILSVDTPSEDMKIARFIYDKKFHITSRCRIINHPILNDDTIIDIFKKANKKHFKLDIDWKTAKTVNFIKKYTEDDAGHMDWHDDIMTAPNPKFGWRALSMSIILEGQFKGGDMEFKNSWDDKDILDIPKLKKYSAIIFNPQLPHRVSLVTEGERIALISWVYTRENIYA